MSHPELILNDTRGDEHMKVLYDKDSLEIQEIQLWDDIAGCFVEIKPVWRYKRDHYATFEKIEKKVAEDHYNQLVGEADRKEDQIYETFKGA